MMSMNVSNSVRTALETLLDKGITDKGELYTKVCEATGAPRPTVRREARNLRNKYLANLKVLGEDSTPQ